MKMKNTNLLNEINFSFNKYQDHTHHLVCHIQAYYSFTFSQIYLRDQMPS